MTITTALKLKFLLVLVKSFMSHTGPQDNTEHQDTSPSQREHFTSITANWAGQIKERPI